MRKQQTENREQWNTKAQAFFCSLFTVHCSRRLQAGFTLIELLVVTAIIVLVSGVVLANQNKFGGQVLLQNFAYDVALSIRQAQVYGLAVARSGSGASAAFSASYGMHFDINSPTTYKLYSDLNNNGFYDSSVLYHGVQVDEADPDLGYGKIMNIKRGYIISDLCVTRSGTGQQCHVSDNKVNAVDIIFQRPEPDAVISWTDGQNGLHGCISSNPQCGDTATITLQSPRGDSMQVTVDDNGQIAVVKP